jgi:hypothetical protein
VVHHRAARVSTSPTDLTPREPHRPSLGPQEREGNAGAQDAPMCERHRSVHKRGRTMGAAAALSAGDSSRQVYGAAGKRGR